MRISDWSSDVCSSDLVCTSPTRFLVHKDIFEAFCERFAAHANNLRVMDPLDPQAQMGPLKNQRRLSAIDGLVRNAVESGATVLAGGSPIEGRSEEHTSELQ